VVKILAFLVSADTISGWREDKEFGGKMKRAGSLTSKRPAGNIWREHPHELAQDADRHGQGAKKH
jgi:hypothetical protein